MNFEKKLLLDDLIQFIAKDESIAMNIFRYKWRSIFESENKMNKCDLFIVRFMNSCFFYTISTIEKIN